MVLNMVVVALKAGIARSYTNSSLRNLARADEARGENMRKFAILFAVLMTAGCTTVTVTPESAQAPPTTYGAVDLTPVKVSDSAFAYLGPFFQKAFVRRLGELNAFPKVGDGPVDPNASNTVYVDATLTKVDKGDAALRWLVGMGAGREHVTAQIQLTDAGGKSIGEFKVRKAYSGGAGIGGAGFLDIEDLTQQVGEQCAQTLVDWSQGKVTTQAAN